MTPLWLALGRPLTTSPEPLWLNDLGTVPTVHTLHDINFQYVRIAFSLEILQSQIQYALNHRLTSQNKLSDSDSMINDDAAKILIDFVYASRCYERTKAE